MITLSSDVHRFLKQAGFMLLVALVFGLFFSDKVSSLSVGPIFFSTLIFSLLFYPILFLGSWVTSPPTSMFVKAVLHIITLPAIIYYILLDLFLLQLLFASPSLDSFVLFVSVTLIAAYLVYRYVRFVRAIS